MLDALPKVQGPQGRPRTKPNELMGDRGYGFPHTIKAVIQRRIKSLLSPRGSPHGSGLGKRRYVVEQSLAALGNRRRLKICYERTAAMWQGFHELAIALMCFKRWQKLVEGL